MSFICSGNSNSPQNISVHLWRWYLINEQTKITYTTRVRAVASTFAASGSFISSSFIAESLFNSWARKKLVQQSLDWESDQTDFSVKHSVQLLSHENIIDAMNSTWIQVTLKSESNWMKDQTLESIDSCLLWTPCSPISSPPLPSMITRFLTLE